MDESKKIKTIYDFQMAAYLILNGCKLVDVEELYVDKKKRIIFYFRNDSKVRLLMRVYYSYRDNLYNIRTDILEKHIVSHSSSKKSKGERQ
jgi:hypothetical protein